MGYFLCHVMIWNQSGSKKAMTHCNFFIKVNDIIINKTYLTTLVDRPKMIFLWHNKIFKFDQMRPEWFWLDWARFIANWWNNIWIAHFHNKSYFEHGFCKKYWGFSGWGILRQYGRKNQCHSFLRSVFASNEYTIIVGRREYCFFIIMS